MAPYGTNHSRYASSVSPALPTTTLAPERSNHRLIDLPKRKLAVAVTASTAWVPSGLTVAAGEQWKLTRSEEHTSELQSRLHLVCRLLLEKKKKKKKKNDNNTTQIQHSRRSLR